MDPMIISLILWVPFGILVLIYGLIYSISGYKKGLLRSLISIGATVAAGIISAIIAKLLSPVITESVYGAMADNGMVDAGAFSDLVDLFAKGVLQSFVTLFLFSSILFVLTIILKVIAGKLSKGKFEPANALMRWAGLGVRLIEAVIFSLLLLLPIYGTFAAYLPIADELMSLETPTEGEDTSVRDIIGKINEHPLLKAVKTKPIEVIYNGLSDSKFNDTNLNIPEMATSVSGILEKIRSLEGLPEDQQKAAVQELIEYAEENLVGQKWFYSMYNVAKSELVKTFNSSVTDLSDEEKKFADEFIKSLDMSEKDFQECAKESLDLAEYVIENDLLQKMEAEQLSVLYYDEFLYRLGEWLNCNESMMSFKKIMVMTSLNEFTGSADASLKLLSNMPLSLHTDKEEQKQEAGAILVLLKGVNKFVVAEGLVRHPDFGYEAIKDYITPYDFANLIYPSDEYDSSNPVVAFLNENPNVVTELMNKLKEYETIPLSDSYYAEYAESYLRSQVGDIDLGGGAFSGVVVAPDGSQNVVVWGDGEISMGGSFTVGNGGIFSSIG